MSKAIYPIDEMSGFKTGVVLGDYSCTLNQTELDSNKNKFYIMQLIKDSGKIYHYIRFGRISEKGKSTNKEYADESTAIQAFKIQFKAKTKNNWSDRDNFKKFDDKYFMSDIKYELDDTVVTESKDVVSTSALDPRTQWLINLFTNKATMERTLVSLDIDTKKMPLGKISKKQLDDAQKLLDSLRLLIGSGKKDDSDSDDSDKSDDSNDSDDSESSEEPDTSAQISSLSSKFYTCIPYACGRKKPPMIDCTETLSKFVELIEELKNLEVAIKITKSGANTVDQVYQGLNTTIQPLVRGSPMWGIIQDYVTNTHGPTHNFKIKLADIYEIARKDESPNVKKCMDRVGNVNLLWHGSRVVNFCSILKNGLILNPESMGVHIAGKMYGQAIYLANSISKSAGYCAAELSDDFGALLLCETALGHKARRLQADCYCNMAKITKENCHSCWGVGQYAPSSTVVLDDGVIVPNGVLRKTGEKSVLLYDEMMVYDTNQLLFKYIVIVKITR
jgi:predicted DNA-binding WGR domain protein